MSIEEAIVFAATAHVDQTDKAGVPYILHPLRVMLACEPEDRVVAVLHDVLEDTDEDPRQFLSASDREALQAITRDPNESYHVEYLARVKANARATRVKLKDIADNMRGAPPGYLRERYEKALAILSGPKP